MNKNVFAANLQQAIEEKGISQTELSRASGIGRSSISQYVSGKNVPEPDRIRKIAACLGMTPEDLMAGGKLDQELDEVIARANEGIEMEDDPEPIPRMSIREVAKYLGMSHETIKSGLIQGVFPWGYAIKTSANRYTFFINARKFFRIEGIREGA